ncbi:hypothetical protein J2X16_002766 [Pelomonas aquatica]|uniref:Uncharacterized protein n=1 Tax=Pelomonas aquatica TaxID=431058 RepID=A0ABU1Z9Z1_9BURK|nr:hypothetical protein [Pelomonas aquatica]MDR7297417.1 hypothetical protein [Pelomonas aquatica]
MRTRTISIEARPVPRTGEKQWFSPLPVPADCARLTTGEPVARDLLHRVRTGIAAATKTLKPGHPYKAKHFVDDWEELSLGDRIRAGRCITDFTRRSNAPIGLIRRGNGRNRQTNRYFVRPVLPRTHRPAPTPQHHQH